MNDETFVVSDLHIGSGGDDKLDDFHADRALADFVRANARAGAELVINGDFIDFVQIEPLDVTGVPTFLLWDEDASLTKVESALTGHTDAFASIGDLLAAGGHVTVTVGNHDLDLAWPRVQRRLREAWSGNDTNIEFIVGPARRHGVHIEHGYQFSPANCEGPGAFIHAWDDRGTPRKLLETRLGHRLHASLLQRPRTDPSVHRQRQAHDLARVARPQERLDPEVELVHLALFLKGRIPWKAMASMMDIDADPGRRPGAELRGARMAGAGGRCAEHRTRRDPSGGQCIEPGGHQAAGSETDGEDRGGRAGRRSRRRAGHGDAIVPGWLHEEACAKSRKADGATHVVFGHTHHAVDGNHEGAPLPYLFNPGSWIPHLNLRDPVVVADIKANGLTLDLIKDPSRYKLEPYAVRIRTGEPTGLGRARLPPLGPLRARKDGTRR